MLAALMDGDHPGRKRMRFLGRSEQITLPLWLGSAVRAPWISTASGAG